MLSRARLRGMSAVPLSFMRSRRHERLRTAALEVSQNPIEEVGTERGHTGGKVSIYLDNAKVGWSLDGDNAGLEIGPLCPPH